jgi:hypothetical protein
MKLIQSMLNSQKFKIRTKIAFSIFAAIRGIQLLIAAILVATYQYGYILRDSLNYFPLPGIPSGSLYYQDGIDTLPYTSTVYMIGSIIWLTTAFILSRNILIAYDKRNAHSKRSWLKFAANHYDLVARQYPNIYMIREKVAPYFFTGLFAMALVAFKWFRHADVFEISPYGVLSLITTLIDKPIVIAIVTAIAFVVIKEITSLTIAPYGEKAKLDPTSDIKRVLGLRI